MRCSAIFTAALIGFAAASPNFKREDAPAATTTTDAVDNAATVVHSVAGQVTEKAGDVAQGVASFAESAFGAFTSAMGDKGGDVLSVAKSVGADATKALGNAYQDVKNSGAKENTGSMFAASAVAVTVGIAAVLL